MRILVIEDDPLVAMVAAETLEDGGHTVIGVAPDAPSAMRLAVEDQPDLLLVDLNLRNYTKGTDAIREIRRSVAVPALFVSGSSEECRSYGWEYAFGCLLKPYSPDELVSAVAAVSAIANGEEPRTVPPNLELYSRPVEAAP